MSCRVDSRGTLEQGCIYQVKLLVSANLTLFVLPDKTQQPHLVEMWRALVYSSTAPHFTGQSSLREAITIKVPPFPNSEIRSKF